MLQVRSASVETRASWAVALAALAILGMSFGASWITAVALKDIAAEVGGARSIPALASSLVVPRIVRTAASLAPGLSAAAATVKIGGNHKSGTPPRHGDER